MTNDPKNEPAAPSGHGARLDCSAGMADGDELGFDEK